MSTLERDLCLACKGDQKAKDRLLSAKRAMLELSEELKTDSIVDRRHRKEILSVANALQPPFFIAK